MKKTDDEKYGADIFPKQWKFIEKMIEKHIIIAPRQIEEELKPWYEEFPEIEQWVEKHPYIFSDPSSKELSCAKCIANKHKAYSTKTNFLGDLALISMAKAQNLVVITDEKAETGTHSEIRPKIPSICNEFGVKSFSIPKFLREEKFTS